MENGRAEVNENDNTDFSFMYPLTIKPMFVMARWERSRTRDERLALFILLPIGPLDQKDGIRAELETAERLAVTFSWPSVLFDADKIMRAVVRFVWT